MVCAKSLSDAGCAQGFSGKEGEEMPLEQRIAEAEMLRDLSAFSFAIVECVLHDPKLIASVIILVREGIFA